MVFGSTRTKEEADMYRRRYIGSRGCAVLMVAVAILASGCGAGGDDSSRPAASGGQTCDSVSLANPPAAPVTIRFAGASGSEAYAALFGLAGAAPASSRPHAGSWYEFDMQVFPAGIDRITALRSGQVDGAVLAFPQTWFMMAAGIRMQSVAHIQNIRMDSYTDTRLLVRNDSPITAGDWKSFLGRTIASTGPQTTFDLTNRGIVQLAGDDPAKYLDRFPAVAPAAMGAALRSGQVDVAYALPPFHVEELAQGGVRQVATLASLMKEYTGADYIANLEMFMDSDFIANNSGPLCAMLSDLRSSMLWASENVEEFRTNEVKLGYVATPLETLLGLPTMADTFPPDAAVDISNLQLSATMAVEVGLLQESQVPNWDTYAAPAASVKN